MNANIIQKAIDLIKQPGITAAIGLIDSEGRPCVSAISSICTDGLDICWFATNTFGRKAELIGGNNKVGICYFDDYNISLSGRAEIITDTELKAKMWLDGFENHFTSPTDDNYCLIKVTVEYVRLYIDEEAADFNLSEIYEHQSYCGLLCDGCEFKDKFHCDTCLLSCGVPFHGKCPVATCCIEKGYSHCGMCPDMPCALLYRYSCEDPEHGDKPKGARLEMLKYWKTKAETGDIK